MKRPPGPWKRDENFICCLPNGKDGDWFIIAQAPNPSQVINQLNDMIAWEANARLICAAPEMLEMLIEISDEWMEEDNDLSRRLDALVKKANHGGR